jgi:hypothetical protein
MTGCRAGTRCSIASLLCWAVLSLVTPPCGAGEEPAAAAELTEAADGEGQPLRDEPGVHAEHPSRLTDELIPLQVDSVPKRPKLLLELGNPYLGTGRIKPGFELATGAVWQPTLILFGTLRTGVQASDNGIQQRTEWANRLDLFGNLQLSGTERLVIGFRNLDRDGRFTSYVFEPDLEDSFIEELNADIETLYFEGDFGEIFPRLDREDFGRKDIGFSIGRQPLLFQDGMIINDSIDGLGITRNTLLPGNASNFRVTFFAGFDNIDRGSVEDESARLAAVLTSTDLRRTTIDADLVWVDGDALTGDLVALGVSATQRLGRTNSTFRVLASSAIDQETPFATDGAVVFSEISWTPRYGHDLVYVNNFWAIDEYSAPAAGPAAGGPLGRAGISFAAVGLGSFGAPLASRAREVVGGAVGYQKFLGDENRRQLLAELGIRVGTANDVADEAAVSLRYQAAMGRRFVWVFDAFGGSRRALIAGDDDVSLWGGRVELRLKF